MAGKLATRKIGDDAVRAKTKLGWEEWFRILDRAGARDMDHRQIVAVVRKHQVDSWWSQMITVAWEQERGGRLAHQRPDGFEISASRTIAAPVRDVYKAWVDARTRAKWLPRAAFIVRKATAGKSLRLTWDRKDTRVEALFYRKGAAASLVSVQHGRLATAAACERMKTYWKARLDKLKSLLEEGA